MVYPSWRKTTDALKQSELTDCDSFVLLSALRGLAPLMREIIKTEKLKLAENIQDLEFVSWQLERITEVLHRRLIEEQLIQMPDQTRGVGKDKRPNRAGSPACSSGPKRKRKVTKQPRVIKPPPPKKRPKIEIPDRLAHILIGKAEVDKKESET